jgi:hypothetical protein
MCLVPHLARTPETVKENQPDRNHSNKKGTYNARPPLTGIYVPSSRTPSDFPEADNGPTQCSGSARQSA